MRCVICKQAEPVAGSATVTLERDGLTLVVKQVPAMVCPNCGEEYLTDEIARQLLEHAEETARHGTQVEIRQYIDA
jgi:YgiT-type zinc finger domain-containing protein